MLQVLVEHLHAKKRYNKGARGVDQWAQCTPDPHKPTMVVYSCNPGTWGMEPGQSGDYGHRGLQETLYRWGAKNLLAKSASLSLCSVFRPDTPPHNPPETLMTNNEVPFLSQSMSARTGRHIQNTLTPRLNAVFIYTERSCRLLEQYLNSFIGKLFWNILAIWARLDCNCSSSHSSQTS